MLKRMTIRKIMISTLSLFVLVLFYLIPDNESEELSLNNGDVEYFYNNSVYTIYLLDSNDYVARTSIAILDGDVLDVASQLVNGLIVDGKKSDIIPNGFKSIIPPGTSILDLSLKNKILTINFSSSFCDVSSFYEEKMIEAIVFTLTSIEGIDKVKIMVEGEELNKLCHRNKYLPENLDKSFGINKTYEITSTNNIDSYTVYYVSSYNDNKYYVPVTKYINNEEYEEKIRIIVDELSSAPIYETNLMSYLNGNTKLIDYSLENDILNLNFNDAILEDISSDNILEEVIYTISLSVSEVYNDVSCVNFLVENRKIYKNFIKTLE